MKFQIIFLSTIGLILAFLVTPTETRAAACNTFMEVLYGCANLAATSESILMEEKEGSFITPEQPEDTLFDRRWYGRLADNSNVYPTTSRASAPVRNVGDGYIFATVINQLQNDALETWYEINPGEFVHGDDIQLAKVSDFQGVETTGQPVRPFGWVVEEVRPSSGPDDEADSDMEKLTRFTFVEIYDAVEGEEDWIWYDIGDGRWVRL